MYTIASTQHIIVTHISIIVLHYNTPQETHRCLGSLARLQLKKQKYDVVVVDNGSREPFALFPSEQKRGVQLVRSESNLGFTGGNNLGIYYAIERFNSEYVCLLNSDTKVESNFLKQLTIFMDEHPRVGAACPLIYFAAGSEYHKESYEPSQRGNIVWYAGGSIDLRNLHAFHKHIDEVNQGQIVDSLDEDFATGCCVMLRREVLEKVSGFDDRYFLYLEDVDLSQRIQDAGYQIALCASAEVWHYNAGSTGGPGSSLHVYYQTRNRFLFFWQYGSWRVRVTLLSWALSRLFKGTSAEQTGIFHAIIQKYGKETGL